MKKLLLLLIAGACYSANEASAQIISNHPQTISNGSFENWINITNDGPGGWVTANHAHIFRYKVATASKVPGATGSAIRLETTSVMGKVVSGLFANGAGDPVKAQGGVPCAQKPTGITGKYKADMADNDSAILMVLFKKGGVLISSNVFKLGGHGQTTFNTFSFPLLSMPVTPDSVIIASASGNIITKKGMVAGSNITIDDLAFTGADQPIGNGDFENWLPGGINIIDGWGFVGDGISRVADAYQGAYAIRLEKSSEDPNLGYGAFSSLSTNDPYLDYSIGGRPFFNQFDTLVGYYKLINAGTDSAYIGASARKDGKYIGGGHKMLPEVSVYTRFEIPIAANVVPDSLKISILPSLGFSEGSVLILDELQLKSAMLHTGITTVTPGKIRDQYFPNPAGNVLNIISELVSTTDGQVSVIDITGKVVMTQHAAAGSMITLNITNLDAGVYFYVIEAAGQTVRNKFVKE